MSAAVRDGRSKPRPGVDAQRDIIVDAALVLFAERGTGVSIGDICVAAKVSRPTFYRCFADRDALVQQLYDEAFAGPLQLNLAAVLTESPTAEGVRAELDAMVERVAERPDVAAFVLAESADVRSPAWAVVRASWDAAADRIAAWYDAHGVAAPSRPALLGIMAACQYVLHEAVRVGAEPAVLTAAKQAMWELVRPVFLGRRG